ncbi:MAG: hypothetical protein R3E01_02130 [Pirellulaceae bacterium]
MRDAAVLDAMRSVPRDGFLPPELHEFAFQNTPLPSGNEQTISQPFMVALRAAALELKPTNGLTRVEQSDRCWRKPLSGIDYRICLR